MCVGDNVSCFLKARLLEKEKNIPVTLATLSHPSSNKKALMECSVFDTHKNETVGYAKFKFKPLRHVYLEKPPNKNNLLWITASHLHITASKKTVNGQHYWSKARSRKSTED